MRKQYAISGMLLFLGLFISTMKGFSQDPDFHIFLCFGQSNMEGQGNIEAQDKTVNSRFQVMEAINCSNLGRTKGAWYTAVPPLTRCYTRLSPADYFGRTMVANLPPNVRVGVVNVSVAGCKIELFDTATYEAYAATAESWMKNIINEYGGNPYARLVEIAKLAQADGVIKGILLHQGESNTGDNTWPAKVKKVYDNLIKDLNLDPETVPLLAGEVVHANQGGICASMNSIIGKLPQTIPNSHVISSSGCTAASDKLHFNSAGYRSLGIRYAEKMLTLMGYDPGDIETGINTGELYPENNSGSFLLNQNYPNPFKEMTSISFEVPENTFVSLKVFDLLGMEIAELAGKEYNPGAFTIDFHPGKLPKGSYIFRMTTNRHSASREMIIL